MSFGVDWHADKQASYSLIWIFYRESVTTFFLKFHSLPPTSSGSEAE
jgi:hypothetical protein